MNIIDIITALVYFTAVIAIGLFFSKKAGKSLESYFLSGRQLPWWLAGISMVATTFAADTPLAVAGIVLTQGISGNWLWISLSASGLLTVFFFADLWRRLGVMTDAEFSEKRYSGKGAAFLRGFRAVYLGVLINAIIIGWVTVGMVKILSAFTDWSHWQIVFVLYTITGIYIIFSGLWGVVWNDFFQFFAAMAGSIILAIVVVRHAGSLEALTAAVAAKENGAQLLSFFPWNAEIAVSSILFWLAFQWWASWYPGAEPGGGGYIAQRMLSVKNPRDAVSATFLFNIMHYAVRPWPWIIVALGAFAFLPALKDPESSYVVAMKTWMPPGLMGLMLVAFFSAFMSTLSTQINWGASYLVNDLYKRFMVKNSSEKHYLFIAKISVVFLLVFSATVSWFFDSVKEGYEFLLALGAGTGLVYLLRWIWWRVNAWSEVSAMITALLTTLAMRSVSMDSATGAILTTGITTLVWITVTFATKPTSAATLEVFYSTVHPYGFWRPVKKNLSLEPLSGGISLTQRFFSFLTGFISLHLILWGTGVLLLRSALSGSFLVLGGIFLLLVVRRILR